MFGQGAKSLSQDSADPTEFYSFHNSNASDEPAPEFYKKHRLLRYYTFSFFSGSEIYHKLALLNKQTRRDLPGSGLLDQVKVLKVKAYPKNIAHLQYAFNLADVIAFDICNMKTKVAGFDLERVASTTQRTQTNYLTKDQYMEILC